MPFSPGRLNICFQDAMRAVNVEKIITGIIVAPEMVETFERLRKNLF